MVTNGKWNSIKDSLPGMERLVFIYCEKSKKMAGHVYLAEHKSLDPNYSIGLPYPHESTGVLPIRWCQEGRIFNAFTPTHWTEFPEPPKVKDA
jgi:hypothetical protein